MKPIEKVSITDMVVSNLKELIISGEYSVGDKLPTEKEICEQLNVGRSTVREAFMVLKAMGFVEIKPGRGAFVAKIKEDEPNTVVNWFIEHEFQLVDYMEVRMALEPLAVKLAIKRASDDEIEMLEKIRCDFEKAIMNNDFIRLVTHDEAFHNEIVRLTHNKLLISINENISNVFREYRSKAFAIKENAKHALGPHRKILEAIKMKDIEAGEREMINHLNISLEDISNVVKAEVKLG